MIHEHKYDVVIVGAGGAGMRAAVEADPRAAGIIPSTKGSL
jgi:succinate dehydrogenase / fumarate reductase flavoprotein subunit